MAEVERKVGISLILKDKMSKSLKKAGGAAQKLKDKAKGIEIPFGKAAGVVGALGVAATGAAIAAFKFAESIAAAGDRMFFMSQKTGVAVEELSQLKFIAEQSGAEATMLQDALKKVSEKAVKGDVHMAKFGIATHDATGKMKSAKQLFMESADIIAKQTSSSEKAAAATMLLGGAGLELIPMLELGADGMGELADKADRLGITMSSTGAALSNEFNNQLGSVQSMFGGLSRTIGENMMPAFIRLFNVMQEEMGTFMPVFDSLVDGIGSGMQIGIKAFSMFLQTIIAVGGSIKSGWHMILIALQTPMKNFIDDINTGIEAMNSLLPATMQMDTIYNAFTDTIDEETKAMDEGAIATGEMIVAVQRMENALTSTDKMTFKSTKTLKTHKTALDGAKKSTEELKKAEEARAKLLQSLEDKTKAFKEEQAAYRLEMQIKMTNELAEAEEQRKEKQIAALEASRAAAEQTANMMIDAGSDIGSAFVHAFGAAEEGTDKFAEGMKAASEAAVMAAISAMEKIVMAHAAEAAAGAASSQAGIPIVGPALAAAAAAMMFGIVKGFIAMGFEGMAEGGLVTGGIPNRDSVPALLMPGEVVIPKKDVENGARNGGKGGTTINVQMDTKIPTNKAELNKFVRQSIVPALRDLKSQGMF